VGKQGPSFPAGFRVGRRAWMLVAGRRRLLR
jgi:hypothetical protein